MKAWLVVLVLLGATKVAAAYPQFQLSRDATCSGCHLSPAGGGLLSENGTSQSEMIAQLDHSGAFMYGKLTTPDWLALGGDIRLASGYFQTPERALASFPMQTDLYAQATFGKFSVHVTAGGRPAREGGSAINAVWSREHYVQFHDKPGEATGLFVRAGRFMPVFGLRFAEHPLYARRYGGTQLYSETYGVALEYIAEKFEAHATGFIEDPLIAPVERGNGAAVYAEYRATEHFSVGAEYMFKDTKFDRHYHYGVTAKLYLPSPDILLQFEGQFVNQVVDTTETNPAGGAPVQLVGNVVASKMVTDFVMVDLGIGHFDSNIRIKDLDRDCVDLNVHYFLNSHTELELLARYELMAFGSGGDAGASALGMLHYRL